MQVQCVGAISEQTKRSANATDTRESEHDRDFSVHIAIIDTRSTCGLDRPRTDSFGHVESRHSCFATRLTTQPTPHSSCSRIPEDLLYLAALDILDHANKLRTWDMRYYLPMSPKLMPCRISSSWNPAHMAVCGE